MGHSFFCARYSITVMRTNAVNLISNSLRVFHSTMTIRCAESASGSTKLAEISRRAGLETASMARYQAKIRMPSEIQQSNRSLLGTVLAP
jgi:hypothetical protein